MSKYDADYFIEKFKKTHHSQWCVGVLHNVKRTKFCVRGHCGETIENFGTSESYSIILILGYYTEDINDGVHKNYQQKEPRSRILAALRDVKKGVFKQ